MTSNAPMAVAARTASLDSQHAIELVGITKRFGHVTALSAVDLDIEDGEFLVLLGPSGCGKSTILKIIAGLEDATEGDVYIAGKLASFLRPARRDVAMVFQNYALYPHMTVAANLGFPLKMRGRPKQDVERRVAEVSHTLELEAELRRYPEQLSGGQRQRVALGRAIIREPVAFLMDEPLSNLDALLRAQMRSELLKLHRSLGHTTVYVTHDQIEAMTMASRIVVLKLGIIQQVGTADDVYARPANTFVATFVGSPQMNLFQGALRVEDTHASFAGSFTVPIDGAMPAGEPATVGIRPEDIEVVGPSEPGAISAGVEFIETIGAESYLSVVPAAGVTLVVRVSAKRINVHEGERVYLRLPSRNLHFFDSSGTRLAVEY